MVFPFLICFCFGIVSNPALNQPSQSDCLDFVLCILFSYTPLFLPLLKDYSTKINFFFVCDVAEVFFLLKLNFLLFVWHSAHIVGALKVQVVICSIQVRNLHKMYFAASCEMQFGDVELYVFVFFQFWGNVKQQIFFFFAN